MGRKILGNIYYWGHHVAGGGGDCDQNAKGKEPDLNETEQGGGKESQRKEVKDSIVPGILAWGKRDVAWADTVGMATRLVHWRKSTTRLCRSAVEKKTSPGRGGKVTHKHRDPLG